LAVEFEEIRPWALPTPTLFFGKRGVKNFNVRLLLKLQKTQFQKKSIECFIKRSLGKETGRNLLERILLLMPQRGISAAILIKEVGLSNSSVSEWKRGKAKPGADAIVKIANYFGVSTDYILKGDTLETNVNGSVFGVVQGGQGVLLLIMAR